MTPEEILAINRERLAGWGAVCVKNHATPIILITLGHDHVCGKIDVIHITDLDKEQLFAVLMYAAKAIQQEPTTPKTS